MIPPAAPTVGGRIAQARSYSRLSQAALIAQVGVDRKTLSSWENDHTSPTVAQLLRIADATGFPASWFVDGVHGGGGDGGRWAPRDSNPQPADTRFQRPELARVA